MVISYDRIRLVDEAGVALPLGVGVTPQNRGPRFRSASQSEGWELGLTPTAFWDVVQVLFVHIQHNICIIWIRHFYYIG